MCVGVYIRARAHMPAHVYTHVHTHVYTHVYKHAHARERPCLHACMHVCLHVVRCVDVHVRAWHMQRRLWIFGGAGARPVRYRQQARPHCSRPLAVRIDVCMDMCIDMLYVDICIGMCTDMLIDMCI